MPCSIPVAGYNVGNLPCRLYRAFGSVGFAATSLFDAETPSRVGDGDNWQWWVGEDEKPSFSGMTKKLFSSIPFDAYIVMTILSILKLRLRR